MVCLSDCSFGDVVLDCCPEERVAGDRDGVALDCPECAVLVLACDDCDDCDGGERYLGFCDNKDVAFVSTVVSCGDSSLGDWSLGD